MRIDTSARLENLNRQVKSGELKFEDRVYKCPLCYDIGFVLRRDDHGRSWGARCDCLVSAIVAAREAKRASGFNRAKPDDEDLTF